MATEDGTSSRLILSAKLPVGEKNGSEIIDLRKDETHRYLNCYLHHASNHLPLHQRHHKTVRSIIDRLFVGEKND